MIHLMPVFYQQHELAIYFCSLPYVLNYILQKKNPNEYNSLTNYLTYLKNYCKTLVFCDRGRSRRSAPVTKKLALFLPLCYDIVHDSSSTLSEAFECI